MAYVAKQAPTLVFAAIFLALSLIGWVARATLAQDAPKELAPPQAAPDPAPRPCKNFPHDHPKPPSRRLWWNPLNRRRRRPPRAPTCQNPS